MIVRSLFWRHVMRASRGRKGHVVVSRGEKEIVPSDAMRRK